MTEPQLTTLQETELTPVKLRQLGREVGLANQVRCTDGLDHPLMQHPATLVLEGAEFKKALTSVGDEEMHGWAVQVGIIEANGRWHYSPAWQPSIIVSRTNGRPVRLLSRDESINYLRGVIDGLREYIEAAKHPQLV